jgi:hypothetical protein
MMGCINHSLRFGWAEAVECRCKANRAFRDCGLCRSQGTPAAVSASGEPLQVGLSKPGQPDKPSAMVCWQVRQSQQMQAMLDHLALTFRQE